MTTLKRLSLLFVFLAVGGLTACSDQDDTKELAFDLIQTQRSGPLSVSIAFSKTRVLADAHDHVVIEISVVDAGGNPVDGRNVTLSVSGTGNLLTQPASPLVNGVTTGTLRSSTPEDKFVTVTVEEPAPSSRNPSPAFRRIEYPESTSPTVEVWSTPVTFIAPKDPDAALSSVSASPTSVVADGTRSSTITVTVRDRDGNPLADQDVHLEANGTGNILAQPASLTNAHGVATGTLRSTVSETKIVTATVNPGSSDVVVTQQATVTFFAPGSGPDPSLFRLPFRVQDAEYSTALDRIVMVSQEPDALHAFDPDTNTATTVPLLLKPECVSVGPDGLHAAVGHDAWVSFVDLSTGTLERMLKVTTQARDIVLAGNDFVYVFPRRDQWERIRCIEIATGAETLHTGSSIRAGTLARLHPGGTAIYGATNGLSPADIEKYGVSGGTANYLYDSPYHGDHPSGGNLWFSEDGLRIFTRPGSVFRASNVPGDDMIYGGDLAQTGWVRWLTHSTAAGKVLVIPDVTWSGPAYEDSQIQVYDDTTLSLDRTVGLPTFDVAGASYASHGQFVFFDAAGSTYYVIVKADPISGVERNYGIATYSLGQGEPPSVPASLVVRENGSTGVYVDWADVPGATGYNVYFAATSGVLPSNYASLPGGGMQSVTSSHANVWGLTADTTYWFVVTASTASGESESSTEAPFTTGSTFASTIPTGVSVGPGDRSVTLNWSPVPDADSYNVYMALESGVGPTTYGELAGGRRLTISSPPAILSSLSNHRLYYFAITAVKAAEESTVSAEVSAVPTPAVPPTIQILSYKPIDAEYSRTLERIVAIADSPPRLYLHDAAAGAGVAVDLPQTPSCVSVEPDGRYAAVGHDGLVSYVDLSTPTLVKTIATTADVDDLVLASNGYAYAVPRTGQWVSIRCINIAAGTDTPGTGWFTYDQTGIKLRPGTSTFYGGTTGISPADIEKYDISAGISSYLYDSPYHGDFPSGAPLWITEDGGRITTGAGTTFRATSVQATDMRYAGTLGDGGTIRSQDDHNNAARIAVLRGDSFVRLYNDRFLTPSGVLALPRFPGNSGTDYSSQGEFVFYRTDGQKIFVVLKADSSSGLLHDHGVVVFDAP